MRAYERAAFDSWMADLDVLLRSRLRFRTADQPDRPYRYWFDQGRDPEGAATLIAKYPL